MKIIKFICDECYSEALSYKIDDGKEMDASGNGYQTTWIYRDYCGNCFDKFTANFPEKRIIQL